MHHPSQVIANIVRIVTALEQYILSAMITSRISTIVSTQRHPSKHKDPATTGWCLAQKTVGPADGWLVVGPADGWLVVGPADGWPMVQRLRRWPTGQPSAGRFSQQCAGFIMSLFLLLAWFLQVIIVTDYVSRGSISRM